MADQALRKICPKSGEKCDCPKGICQQAIMAAANVFELKLFHEQSHEHDARQLAVYQQAAEIDLSCKGCQSYGFAKSKLGPDRCEFCDGTFSGNPPTAEEIEAALEYASMKTFSEEADAERRVNESEAAQADHQEAGSLKYALCAQVLLLSSGKFALYGAYAIGEGIPLIAIDTWENLESHVRAYRKTAEESYEGEMRDKEQHVAKVTVNYDSLFGED